MAKGKTPVRHDIRCYLCGHTFEVSSKTLSTTCPKCHRAIKVEDINIKSYTPVNDVQTCGRIIITQRGRIAAKRIMSGEGIICNGSIEGEIDTVAGVELGPKAAWKGKSLRSGTLKVAAGATLSGQVNVPKSGEERPGA